MSTKKLMARDVDMMSVYTLTAAIKNLLTCDDCEDQGRFICSNSGGMLVGEIKDIDPSICYQCKRPMQRTVNTEMPPFPEEENENNPCHVHPANRSKTTTVVNVTGDINVVNHNNNTVDFDENDYDQLASILDELQNLGDTEVLSKEEEEEWHDGDKERRARDFAPGREEVTELKVGKKIVKRSQVSRGLSKAERQNAKKKAALSKTLSAWVVKPKS